MTQSKIDRLRELALERQKDTSWPEYYQVGYFHDGAYECEHVSPYTKSASNVDAEVFLMLQDWSSSDRLNDPLDADTAEHGHDPTLDTNRNLKRLLPQHLNLSLSQTYATNLFPFIKKGEMKATIPVGDLTRAAQEYALPQVRIVRPRLVVCLGIETFKAMQRACGQSPLAPRTADAIAAPFEFETSTVWCQSHPGTLGTNNRNHGGVDRVNPDWATMGAWLRLHS